MAAREDQDDELLASEALKLLGSCTEEDEEVAVTLATIALRCLKLSRGSKPALGKFQSCAVEMLQFTASEIQSHHVRTHLPPAINAALNGVNQYCTTTQFWCSCYNLLTETTTDLLTPITSLRTLSERCTHLMLLFLRVADRVLIPKEIAQFVEHLCKNFWRKEISHLASELQLMDATCNWSRCIQNLAFAHIVQSMHSVLCQSISQPSHPGKEEHHTAATHAWLCSDVLSPVLSSLANTAPSLVYKTHQQWLKNDQKQLRDFSGMDLCVSSVASGQVLKSYMFLVDALSVLTAVASGSQDKTLRKNFSETILRLANHYWEELALIVKEVPQGLPLKVWYLVLSSSLLLHSHLSTFHTTLGTSNSLQEHFPQLLHTLSEFCDGLRENVVSYHSELCIASLLHDSGSHDWQNTRPFFEGERCSFSVQMWHYHLHGLRHDLWTICPGPVAVDILTSVLARTLSHLARRYTAVQPSYRRVAQFRADILAILVSTVSLLPLPLTSTSMSAKVTTIHQSCAVLLATLAVGGCHLEQLHTSLAHLHEGWSNNPSRGQLLQWMKHLDLSKFGIVIHSPGAATWLGDFTTLVSLPYPKWELLLKVLLARDGALAVALCSGAGDLSLLPHVALVLAHCYHRPHSLSNLFTALGNDWSVAPSDLQVEANPCLTWLSDIMKEELQSCVLSGAMEFCSRLKQSDTIHNPPSDILECVLAVIGGLESCLDQLPQPVINVLWRLAGVGFTATQTPDSGSRLAKVMCILMRSWLDPSSFFPSSSLLPLMTTYCSVLKHTLQGTLSERGHPELTSLGPNLLRLLWQQSPRLEERMRQFAPTLQQTPLLKGEEDISCMDAEHEVVAEVLATDSRVLRSLEVLYPTLKTNKTSITKALSTHPTPLTPLVLTTTQTEVPSAPEFNPLTVCISLGGDTFSHQKLLDTELNWQTLLDGFALDVLGKVATAAVVANRPEFQEGAQLEGDEPALVEAIKASLQ